MTSGWKITVVSIDEVVRKSLQYYKINLGRDP